MFQIILVLKISRSELNQIYISTTIQQHTKIQEPNYIDTKLRAV